MAREDSTEKPRDVAARLFSHSGFTLLWVAFLMVFIKFVSWHIRNCLLVFWVYGREGYFQKGIRVLKGKPIRFSNGQLAPILPDMVTAFGVFFVSTIGLTILLIYCVRFYGKHIKSNRSNVA